MTKKQPKPRHREKGIIKQVNFYPWRGKDKQGTVFVEVYFGATGQGFGGLPLDDQAAARFVGELLQVFGVTSSEQLRGQACYALRCFTSHGALIEGLESVQTGRKLTIAQFRKELGVAFPTPLEVEQQDLRASAAALSAQQQGLFDQSRRATDPQERRTLEAAEMVSNESLRQTLQRLKELEEDYFDWG